MNTRLFAGLVTLATAGLLAIGCGSTASFTETEDDHLQSDDAAEMVEPGAEIDGFTETEDDHAPMKTRK